MAHAFSQSKHSFGQYEHFSQVELFEKPWFVIMREKLIKQKTHWKNKVFIKKPWDLLYKPKHLQA
jgi:hypothetical protein